MSGKGSRPRPFSVTQEEFDKKFDSIFGKKPPKEPWVPPPVPEDIVKKEPSKDKLKKLFGE